MKLTVLGRYGPYPAAGGACSGYLVEDGAGHRLLLDCGNGVLSRLQGVGGYGSLAAVVLSHLHADHVSDLFILRYALDHDRQRGIRRDPLLVHAPPEPAAEFERLPFKDVFDVRAYTPADVLYVGGMTIRFAPARHPVPTCAVGVEEGGRKFVYSADTGYSPEVAALARGADLFLCEANFFREEGEGHLNAFQAGCVAREAGVRRLLITHLHPLTPPAEQLDEAQAGFGGPAELAMEGCTYEI